MSGDAMARMIPSETLWTTITTSRPRNFYIRERLVHYPDPALKRL
jgi:hypothetical protein